MCDGGEDKVASGGGRDKDWQVKAGVVEECVLMDVDAGADQVGQQVQGS